MDGSADDGSNHSGGFYQFSTMGEHVLFPASKNEKYNEEYYYILEYSDEKREKGLHIGRVMSFPRHGG